MKKYGLGRFIIDCILVVCTGGLWAVWLAFKFLRKNS